MEIDKSQCDGTVMRNQSTNLLQVKRAIILFLEKKDLARRDFPQGSVKLFLILILRRKTLPRPLFCAHYYDWGAYYEALAYVNHLIFPFCLVLTVHPNFYISLHN